MRQHIAAFLPASCGASFSSRQNDEQKQSQTVALLLDGSHFLPRNAPRQVPGSLPGPLTPSLGSFNEAVKATVSKALKKIPSEMPLRIYSSYTTLHVIRDISENDGIEMPTLSTDEIKKAVAVFDTPGSPYPTAKTVTNREAALEFELMRLESIANHVAHLPGRRALIWFCDDTSFLMSRHDKTDRITTFGFPPC